MRSKFITLMAILASILSLSSCKETKPDALTASGLNPESFISEINGKKTALYTLTNANGMEACITNYGGRIVSLMVPDSNGKLRDVVLGFDSIEAYLPENNQTDFGAAIGRYANRINQGRFVIDGDTIQLPQNNYGHCLHGGPTGWQYQVYEANQPNDSTVVLTLKSPDGDNNFPGNVDAQVIYTLNQDNSLDIRYSATTNKPTVVNMTNHAYFNLSGNPSNSIEDNILYLNASSFTPVDSTFMTTGEILSVKNSPMDFTTPNKVGININNFADVQIKNGHGFDHNWVLYTNGDISVPAAILTSPESGITLTVYTDEPGIQFYSGNFLDGTVKGKNNIAYNKHAALCLETQHYPDSPNKPHWPSTVLRPGETYISHTIFKFNTVE